MASINVDVDLAEFNLSELLEEVEYRYDGFGHRGAKNRGQIDAFFKKMKIDGSEFEQFLNLNLSLLDKMKIDFLLNNLSKISINDLEKIAV